MSFKEVLNKLKNGDFTLFDYIIFTEDELNRLARKLNWKGSGNESDPFLIDNAEGLPQKLSILECKLYINFIDCKFNALLVDNSQNISFTGCIVELLNIFNSIYINLKSSLVSRINLIHSTNNFFEECTIIEASISDSRENTFRNCVLNKKTIKVLTRDNPRYRKLFIFLFLLGIPVIFGFTGLMILSIDMNAYWVFIITLPIFLIIIINATYKKQKRIIEFPANKIISNLTKRN